MIFDLTEPVVHDEEKAANSWRRSVGPMVRMVVALIGCWLCSHRVFGSMSCCSSKSLGQIIFVL